MFGGRKGPIVRLSLPEISLKAQDMVGKLSISGVQPKISVKFDKKSGELVPVSKEGEYILKPQPQTFPHLPENEQCCMDIAEVLGIDVPEHCLLPLSDGTLVYVVKRFDRQGTEKVHQEDFSQILGKDKYDSSVEQIGHKLKEISSVPGLDGQLFFERVVLNFLIGNADAHLKNYSVSYGQKMKIRLSPAYDIVSSRLAIPGELEESALTVNGKKNRLAREDFETLARYLKVPVGVRYDKFIKKQGQIKDLISSSDLTVQEQKDFISIVKERYRRMDFI